MTARQRPVSPVICQGITCRDRILRWLINRIQNPTDAEDIAGEICLHCLKGMRRFRGEAEFATWRHRIILNVFRDYLRAKDRQAERETSGITEAYPTAPADSRASVEKLDTQAERVRAAFCQLTPRQRHLIEWKYGDGLTYEEIASRLNISAAAVSQALYRARLALRRLIDTDPATGPECPGVYTVGP